MTQMTPDPITGEYGPDPMLRGIMGLGGGYNPYEQILNPQIQKPHTGITRQPPGGRTKLPYDWDFGPQGGGPQQPTQNPWQQPPQQNPWMGMGLGAIKNIHDIPGQMTGFGEQLGGFGEQMGGFGETLGGYQDLLGGYGEQLGGFGEQLGGFKDEFSGINDKLQNLEQGISSLTDKFGTQQQQSPYQQNFGMNPFGSFNSYNPYFGGLGMFMRRY